MGSQIVIIKLFFYDTCLGLFDNKYIFNYIAILLVILECMHKIQTFSCACVSLNNCRKGFYFVVISRINRWNGAQVIL